MLHGENDPFGTALGITGQAMDAFIPTGTAPTILQSILPTQARWLADLTLNKGFTGGPIYPERPYSTAPNAEMSFKHTTELSKAIAQSLNYATGGNKYVKGRVDIPPDAIDYIVAYMAGPFAADVMLGMSTVKKALSPTEAVSPRQIPLVRRFYAEPNDYQNITDLFQNAKSAQAALKEYEYLREVDRQKAREYKNTNIALVDTLNNNAIVDGAKDVRAMMKRQKDLEAAGNDVDAQRLSKKIVFRAELANRHMYKPYEYVKER
jgi:hypothetical protein